MTLLMIIPLIVAFLAALYVVPSWYTRRGRGKARSEVYACGERGEPVKTNIRFRYVRFLAFFMVLEFAPLLLASALLLGEGGSLLATYTAIVALAALILTTR